MLQEIETLLHFGINVSFTKEFNHFLIELIKEDKKEKVLLPMDHLTDHSIKKYLILMREKILK